MTLYFTVLVVCAFGQEKVLLESFLLPTEDTEKLGKANAQAASFASLLSTNPASLNARAYTPFIGDLEKMGRHYDQKLKELKQIQVPSSEQAAIGKVDMSVLTYNPENQSFQEYGKMAMERMAGIVSGIEAIQSRIVAFQKLERSLQNFRSPLDDRINNLVKFEQVTRGNCMTEHEIPQREYICLDHLEVTGVLPKLHSLRTGIDATLAQIASYNVAAQAAAYNKMNRNYADLYLTRELEEVKKHEERFASKHEELETLLKSDEYKKTLKSYDKSTKRFEGASDKTNKYDDKIEEVRADLTAAQNGLRLIQDTIKANQAWIAAGFTGCPNGSGLDECKVEEHRPQREAYFKQLAEVEASLDRYRSLLSGQQNSVDKAQKTLDELLAKEKGHKHYMNMFQEERSEQKVEVDALLAKEKSLQPDSESFSMVQTLLKTIQAHTRTLAELTIKEQTP